MQILNDLKDTLDFKMDSAYDFLEVDYSNYTKTFCGLLDYIFFTNQHLELVQVNMLACEICIYFNVILTYL